MRELGDITADPRSGYSYSRISNPTTTALGAAYAESALGRPGSRSPPVWTLPLPWPRRLRAGDRVVAPQRRLRLHPDAADRHLHPIRCARRFRDLTDNAAAAARPSPTAPTRVVYAETIANPTTVVTDHEVIRPPAGRRARRDLHRRQHVRTAYICRPPGSARTSSSNSATKFLPATATSSPGSSRAART